MVYAVEFCGLGMSDHSSAKSLEWATGVAQLAEQLIPNQQVGGSSPPARASHSAGRDLWRRLE